MVTGSGRVDDGGCDRGCIRLTYFKNKAELKNFRLIVMKGKTTRFQRNCGWDYCSSRFISRLIAPPVFSMFSGESQ
jgi:hypothetical protein